MLISQQLWRIALATISAVGFSTSLIAHVLTYMGVAIQDQYSLIWVLHIGIFIVFVPLILTSRRLGLLSVRYSFAEIPLWPRMILVICFLYAGVAFVAALLHIEDALHFVALSTYRPGTYQYHIYELRMMSAVWLAFYLLSTLFYIYDIRCVFFKRARP